MRDADRLQSLLDGGHACLAASTYEEDYLLVVIREVAGRLQRPGVVWSGDTGVRDLLVRQPPMPSTTEFTTAIKHLGTLEPRTIAVLLDPVPYLRNERQLRVFRTFISEAAAGRGPMVVLADHSDDFPPVVRAHSVEFELSLPNEEELELLVRETLRSMHAKSPIDIDIRRSELGALVRNLRGLSRRQAEQVVREAIADRRFDSDDLDTVLVAKRRMLASAGLLEFIEAPHDLDDIGGLRRLKQWLSFRKRAFTDEANAFGLEAPRGVLLLGVQGAGKSLCAKAIATAWQRPLLRLDVSALYDRYVGESERRLQDALRQAEAMSPMILWVDEIEKGFASAAAQSTDGGLSQRMFGTLLTWMQEHRAPVFLVATANNIDALPPELLRKGRFDEIFFVDLPTDDVRKEIFAIHLRKRRRDPASFDLDRLAAESAGFSGAEIEQAILTALHEAFGKQQDLSTEQICAVLGESPPLSVTMAEKVATLRAWARQRCMPAD